MSAVIAKPVPRAIEYPDSDGQPMAENTVQYEYIVAIKGNLDDMFRDRPDVFVAGDHLWYPVEGHPEIRTAPDEYVAFGRPKGHRGSFKQWEEGNIPPEVVFEILSPSNRGPALLRKFLFYQQYGAQEYYIFDPDTNELNGWQRRGDDLIEVEMPNGYVSPLLGVRFELKDDGLMLYRPDGRQFLTFAEMALRAEQERQRADTERRRAERWAAQLRALGVEPNSE